MRASAVLLALATAGAAEGDAWGPLRRAQDAARASGKCVFLYVHDAY